MRPARRRGLWLAAVTLALAVGLVIGARIPSMVANVRGHNTDLREQISELDGQNKALSQKLSAADEFNSQMSGRIVRDALAGKSVVLFRTPDAEDADVEAVSALIDQAGGKATGTVGLTDEFVQANSAEKLRSVVNSPIVPTGAQLNTTVLDPSGQAGDLLGIALLINRDTKTPPVNDEARGTVLAALRDTGFLTYDKVGAADTAVVITGGALPEDAGNQGVSVARFAAALAPHGSGVVLAGRDGSAGGTAALAVARGDAELGRALTTVDDIGAESGRITTVLALQAMIGGAPPGKYGIGAGAASVTVQ